MSNEQENKDLTAKQLPCGGWAIFGTDSKSKTRIQLGYVGPKLSPDAYLKGIRVEK